MAYWSEQEQTLAATVAYVGADGSGKTAILDELARRALWPVNEGREEIETELGDLEGCRARVRVRVGLEGTEAPDGVVLVLDARSEATARNLLALGELREQMSQLGLRPERVPVVAQLNQIDQPTALPRGQVLGALGVGAMPCSESVASEGRGVLEGLREVMRLVLREVREQQEARALVPSAPAPVGPGRLRSGSFLTAFESELAAMELPAMAVNDDRSSFGQPAGPTERADLPPAVGWAGWSPGSPGPTRPTSGPTLAVSSPGGGRSGIRSVPGSSVVPVQGSPETMMMQTMLDRLDAFESSLPLKLSGLVGVLARDQNRRLDAMQQTLEEVRGHVRGHGETVQQLVQRLEGLAEEMSSMGWTLQSMDDEQVEGGQFRSWTAGRLEDVQAQFVGLSERLRQIGSLIDRLGGRSEEVRDLIEETSAHVGASGVGLSSQMNELGQQIHAMDARLSDLKRDHVGREQDLARAVSQATIEHVRPALEAASEVAARRMVPTLVPALVPALEEASGGAERRIGAALGGLTAAMGRLHMKLGGQDATSLGERLDGIEERLAALSGRVETQLTSLTVRIEQSAQQASHQAQEVREVLIAAAEGKKSWWKG